MTFEAVKDADAPHPVASAWRPAFADIVHAFVRADYGIPCVAPLSAADAEHIRSYIADYGQTLAELPDQSWETSIAQWMDDYWEVLVDLWTVEEGRSDMVLSARVYEDGAGFRIVIHMVYVP